MDGTVVSKQEAAGKIANIGEAFLKPTVDSCSGNGCMVVNFQNGVDMISGQTVMQVIEKAGADFVIQERIRCHAEIASIYPHSVNTFRVMSYRWKEKLLICPVIMRIGQGGSYLDNAHAGRMFIAVNHDGTLHKTAFTEFKKEFTKHPDTGLEYDGYQITLFPKVLEAVRKMHDTMPQIGVANWDFTIDTEGNPVLLEVNLKGGSVWLFEMAHGVGAFGDNTEEILKWMRCLKKKKMSDWHKFRFGKEEI